MPKVSKTRHLIGIRIPPELNRALKKYAQAKGAPITAIVERAIQREIGEDLREHELQVMRKSLVHVERRLATTISYLEALSDLYGHYVYHWFCHTTPPSPEQRNALAAQGKARYQKFIEILKGKRGRSPSLLASIHESPLDGTSDEKNPDLDPV